MFFMALANPVKAINAVRRAVDAIDTPPPQVPKGDIEKMEAELNADLVKVSTTAKRQEEIPLPPPLPKSFKGTVSVHFLEAWIGDGPDKDPSQLAFPRMHSGLGLEIFDEQGALVDHFAINMAAVDGMNVAVLPPPAALMMGSFTGNVEWKNACGVTVTGGKYAWANDGSQEPYWVHSVPIFDNVPAALYSQWLVKSCREYPTKYPLYRICDVWSVQADGSSVCVLESNTCSDFAFRVLQDLYALAPRCLHLQREELMINQSKGVLRIADQAPLRPASNDEVRGSCAAIIKTGQMVQAATHEQDHGLSLNAETMELMKACIVSLKGAVLFSSESDPKRSYVFHLAQEELPFGCYYGPAPLINNDMTFGEKPLMEVFHLFEDENRHVFE